MDRIQVQGVHHITIHGSTRQSAIDFWEGLLGMPFIMEQPNLGKPDESHLYFDPGDGRLITVFTKEDREDDATPNPREIGHVDHLAFKVSRAVHAQVSRRLSARGIDYKAFDRGFMDSIYFRDPNGLLVELACYKFEAPEGLREVDILMTAHKLRVEAGANNITDEHLADAIALPTRKPIAVSKRSRSHRRGTVQVTRRSSSHSTRNGRSRRKRSRRVRWIGRTCIALKPSSTGDSGMKCRAFRRYRGYSSLIGRGFCAKMCIRMILRRS
jgi:glyoxalase family protein